MRGWGLVWASVRKGEVYCYRKSNFTTSKHIFQKGVSLINFKSAERKLVLTKRLLLLIGDQVFSGPFFNRCKGKSGLTHVLMFARLCRLQEINSNWTLYIITCKVCCQYINQVPIETTSNSILNFRFVNWFPDSRGDLFMDKEEVHPAHIWEWRLGFEDNFLSWSHLLFFSSYLDCATLSCTTLIILDWSFEGLVSGRDNFMDSEVHCTDEIVFWKIV